MGGEDRPFGGDGSRYQNWAGRPPHWWNISYDTHSKAQRVGRNAMRVAYVVWFVAVLVVIVTAVASAR